MHLCGYWATVWSTEESSSRKPPDKICGSPPSYLIGARSFYPSLERSWREYDDLRVSGDEIKNVWIYTSILLQVCMTCTRNWPTHN